jgi:tetratricopeptide (TPR) repeat protein
MEKHDAITYSIFGVFLLLCLQPTLFSQSEEASRVLETYQQSVISFVSFDKEKRQVGQGTGFIIGPELMLTNYSLISQAEKVEGFDFKGKKVKIEGIIGVDKNYNLAILKAKSKSPALAMGNIMDAGIGNKVFALGGSENGSIQVSEGTIEKFTEYSANQRIIETTAEAMETFAGAPIVGMDGKVLGILVFLDARSKFTLPANLFQGISRQSKHTKFKDQTPEDYFTTYEGAYLAGRVYSVLGRNSQAEKALKTVLQFKPDELDAHLKIAKIQVDQRNYGSAASTFSKIIEIDPSLDSAQQGLGDVYLKMRKWKEAIPPLTKAAELNPDNTEAYYLVGTAHEELREFDQAAVAFKIYLDKNPGNPGDTFYHLGICQLELNQLEDAAVSFEKAIEIDPLNTQTISKLADVYQKSGQYDKAAETYTKLTEVNPDDAKYYFNTIIKMYDEAGMPDKAIEATKQMIDLNPQDADAIYNLGYMYVKLKNYDEAINTFKRAIEVRPDFEFAYSNLGYCYIQQKKYNESIETYKKLVEINPENPDGWMSIGTGYMYLKKFDPAVAPLQRAIELRPDNAYAYYNLGICYLNLQDYQSARDIHKKLQTVNTELAAKLQKLLR